MNDGYYKNTDIGNDENIGFGSNIFNSASGESKDDNFFVEQDVFSVGNDITEPIRHLNDYDFNILKEDAYKDISDDMLKLEYKIEKLEKEQKECDAQIQSARDISDYDTVEYQLSRKKQIQEDLANLMQIYNNKSLSSGISGRLFNVISPKIKEHFSKFNKAVSDVKDAIISSLPGNFSSIAEVKQSLNKLENINKNVDELIKLQAPYGENGEKYDQLSKYILRANEIQARISKLMR